MHRLLFWSAPLLVVGCTSVSPASPERVPGALPSSARVANTDTAAPTGTVTIAEGAAAVNRLRVTLGLSATDDTAVTQMCVSNTSTCSSWVSYATTHPWSFPSTGPKSVYVRFRDAAGNVSAVARDSIVIDTVRPNNGVVTVSGSDGALDVSWSGFSDSASGVASYAVYVAVGTTVAPTCGGTVASYLGTASSTRLLGLANGATYALRVCAVDGAGNVSTGVTTTGRPAPDYTPPSGSIVLADGASWTTGRTVSASVEASGATDVTEVCVAEGATCQRWLPMADTVSVGMTLTQGVHTVRAWFKDAWGNVSASPVTDTIGLDSMAPTGGTVAAAGGDGAVELSWSGFADATSGVASYVVMGVASATAPTRCTSGTPLYAGTGTRFEHTGLTNGATWSYRVCAVDVAGNMGTGVTATARPAPDYTAPTGTIVLAGGAAWTRTADVAVTLTATGATDITGVCLSETTTCTRWSSYAATTTMRLRATAGTHTVRAWFRDAWGNVSATPVSDTIGLDRMAPSGRGVVTATPGAGRVTLAWSGFTDGATGSGVTRYRVVTAAGTRAPTSCTAGSVVYEGTAARATHRDAQVGTTYQYRVCAIDLVGNMGRGATASATVRTANQAPTAPVVALSSTTPAEGDALTCTVTTPATDADRDALSYVFSWDVDGEAYDGGTLAADGLSSTVPADVTAGGEVWTCTVMADDGATYGEAASAEARIGTCGDVMYAAVVAGLDPVAYWSLDETSGVFRDDIGGHDGTLVGSATRAAAGLLRDGAAVELGGGGHIEIPFAPALASASFSVSLWLRVDGDPSVLMAPFSNRGSPYWSGWNLYTVGEFRAVIGDGSDWAGLGGGVVTAGAVTHVVATYDAPSSTLTMYVNGASLGTGSTHHATNPSAALSIGALNDGGSWRFVGALDGVALWDRALAASDVQALYNAGCE
jgi:hypothetical protein